MSEQIAIDADGNPDGILPIHGNERLYRRVPIWFAPWKPKQVPQKAFMPRVWKSAEQPGDSDGLSIDRAKLTTIDAAATMVHNGKKAFLFEFGVEDVLRRDLTVIHKPITGNPAHSLIPEMNSLDRRDPAKEKIMEEHAISLRDVAVLVFEAPSNQ